MKITHVTYAKVGHNQSVPAMKPQPHDAKVDAFLVDHLTTLLALAANPSSPRATFTDPTTAQLFQNLRFGAPTEFLAAARQLTALLIGRMDKRTADGLLVCLRAEDGAKVSGAALKLEVVTEHAAVLDQLASGEIVLAAATNVLDAPGELQKGALVNDPRPDSDVVVGDRLAQNAIYFPQAFGIRTEQRSADSAAAVVEAVVRHVPGVASAVASAVQKAKSGTTSAVLAEVSAAVPAVTGSIAAAVEAELAQRARPVIRVDTQAPIRRFIEAEGITISGPASTMAKVEVKPDGQGGWQVVIPFNTRPRETYRK